MYKIFYKIIIIELSLDSLDLKSEKIDLKNTNKIRKRLINLKHNISNYIKDLKEVDMTEENRGIGKNS